MRAHIIGIAGPSSSGKTELAKQLVRKLPGTSIVSLDSYYRGMEEIPLEERKKVNFDHPDSLDWPLLHQPPPGHRRRPPLRRAGLLFRGLRPHHCDPTHQPSDFVIVEGLFVLYWPELRAMLDTKVYVRTDAGVCFDRRLARDVAERGRTPESVREQYLRTVLPSAEWFVYPTMKYADLVVSGEEPFATSTGAVLSALDKALAAAGGR